MVLLRQRLVRNRVVRALLRPALPVGHRSDLVRLGTDYGGWWVPSSLLGPESIVYSAGVGGDISFDLALIEQFGCHIWGFDPTPFSIAFVAAQKLPPEWHFEPVGLWTERTSLIFSPVAGQTSGSSSITRPGNDAAAFAAPVDTLPNLMARFGHDHVDVLKMDIEGAEGPVLDDLLQSTLRPSVLLVEYDQPELPWSLLARIRRVLSAGYELNHVEDWNYTFTWTRPRRMGLS